MLDSLKLMGLLGFRGCRLSMIFILLITLRGMQASPHL